MMDEDSPNIVILPEYYSILGNCFLDPSSFTDEGLLESEFAPPRVHENVSSSLLNKLKSGTDFPVTSKSNFDNVTWLLDKRSDLRPRVIRFYSADESFNYLKRLFSYHLLPAFNPFSTIRSFDTTETYAEAFFYVEKYVFSDNGLDASPSNIAVITEHLLNQALDSARESFGSRHYSYLFFYITFWISLSEQQLLPIGYRLGIPLRKIDTKSRRKDIQASVDASKEAWKPFDRNELKVMLDYALFWGVSAIPVLEEAHQFLENNNISFGQRSFYLGQSDELERIFGYQIDGKTIIGFDVTYVADKAANSDCQIGRQKKYSIKMKYVKAYENVRYAAFIFVALLTGLRRAELGLLKDSDFSTDASGNWQLTVTRLKTSTDPNYSGDADVIPIPDFLGELLTKLVKMRRRCSPAKLANEFLFISSFGAEPEAADSMIAKLALRLGKLLGLDNFHTHRFRKTIAEILINRSERNIDLIRMLFGHKSYKMSLRYIARNPYLVDSIVETLEEHYAADFFTVVKGVRAGVFAGGAAEKVAAVLDPESSLFDGTMLPLTIAGYVSNLLEAGEPLFIQRTTLNTYCIANEVFSETNLPPCLKGRMINDGNYFPDVSNCQLECRCVAALEQSIPSLQTNVNFYTKLLENMGKNINHRVASTLLKKIEISNMHLQKLRSGLGGKNQIFTAGS